MQDLASFWLGSAAATENAAGSTDPATPDWTARETIGHLQAGRLAPKTVEDLGRAVDRAKADQATSRAFRLPSMS